MRLTTILVGLLALGLLLGPGLAVGADEHGTGEQKAGAEHGGGEFKLIPDKADLGLWSLILFLLLMAVLWKVAWKPMLAGLTAREEGIRGALEAAERTKREAEEAHARHKAELEQAGAKVAAMLDEARRDAVGVKEQLITEAKGEIQKERDRLHRELDMAKDQALNEIWQKAVDLAALMSTKAMRREITADDHRRLLDESLAELHKAVGEVGKRDMGTGR